MSFSTWTQQTIHTSLRMSLNLYQNVLLSPSNLLNDMFCFNSSRRLSYRRPSMWTAMSWLSLTTCLYTTIPSMGEGLADSTLQKVRLLIWRMVGTFLHLIICYAPFSHSFFQTSSHFFSSQITHLVASSCLEAFVPPSLSFFFTF